MFDQGVQYIWDATWQNQQNGCAPSEDPDQPGHPPSLIRVFAVRMKKTWVLSYPLRAQQRLIRLGGCPGCSESSLGAQPFCWFWHVAAHMNKHPDQSLSIDYYSSSVAFSATFLTFRPFWFNKDQINNVKWKCHIAMTRYESQAKPWWSVYHWNEWGKQILNQRPKAHLSEKL